VKIVRPEPPLTDETIRLEALSRSHLDDMESLSHDPEVARHTYVNEPSTADDAVVWVARYIRGWQDGSCAGFAVVDGSDGTFLGFCALVTVDADGMEAEIGYITAPAARGRGIATRALLLISDWALTTIGLQRLELRIAEDNPASRNVAERAGFQKEGLLRSVHLKQGRRTDLNIYARTP
jgi:RimJ/RimL family protein N-acetyltransferase